jgi:hypothetical protein
MMNNTNNVANHYNVSIPTTSLPDGRYELNITSSDINGNNNQTYYFNITIDNTAPTVIFNYQTSVREVWSTPGNNSYRSGTINVNVTIADALADVFTNNQLVRIGNRTHWMGPALIMSTVTGDLAGYYNRTNGTTVLADGFYNITITANDTAGNVVTNTTYFNVDNTAPSAVIALSNSTRGTYRANSSEQIRIQINDAVQTNATIDVYTRWPNGSVIFKSATAVPGTATVYNFTIDTSDLVTDQMVKYYIAATDNASNAATLTGTLSSPLSNITIDVNCGNVGNPLSWCSGSSLKATANGWASTSLPPKASVESISSLQSNFTISNVTKRSGIWGQFNYTYYYDGSSWLAFDPNSPPSTNTLKTFNNTGAQLYWFNVNASNVVFRIQ